MRHDDKQGATISTLAVRLGRRMITTSGLVLCFRRMLTRWPLWRRWHSVLATVTSIAAFAG